MSNDWVNRFKVAKINKLIDQQIVLRTEQLATFVWLKRSIESRMVRGELRRSDLKMIQDELGKLEKSKESAK